MSKEKLSRIRGGHCAYVSRITKNTNEILTNFNNGSTTDRDKLEGIKVTLKKKKNLLKEIDENLPKMKTLKKKYLNPVWLIP